MDEDGDVEMGDATASTARQGGSIERELDRE